jgi:hypothetical protein
LYLATYLNEMISCWFVVKCEHIKRRVEKHFLRIEFKTVLKSGKFQNGKRVEKNEISSFTTVQEEKSY